MKILRQMSKEEMGKIASELPDTEERQAEGTMYFYNEMLYENGAEHKALLQLLKNLEVEPDLFYKIELKRKLFRDECELRRLNTK